MEYYSEEEWEMENSEGEVPVRGVQWVIMGHPMADRHVYAQRLSKLLGVPHISMGSLVRQELHPHSSLYQKIANSVNQGKLVPEDIIFGLLSKRLEEGYSRSETGFILDGIPRTRIQAAILDQVADIDLVVNFKCTESALKQQFLGLSNSGLNPLSVESESILKKKLLKYTEQSKQLEDYYRKQKKLFNFQVAGAPGDTWQGLLAALHLQHMNAINSSQKLTA